MKVLVVGRGGREHTVAWKFAQSDRVEKVYVAPGNDGMVDVAELVAISETEQEKLVAFAKDENIELVFVGPENPLLEGLVDRFQESGIKAFGPNQKAALIEGSKTFAKELMVKYNIPTGAYAAFTNYEDAKKYVEEQGAPIVIKADGLAAGKGVTVAMTLDEALEALKENFLEERFGEASQKVVVEEFLAGEEFSLMAFVNGSDVYPMVISQDHKRAYDNDEGPNTGGMGAYSPVPQIKDADVEKAVQEILIPTAQAMIDEDRYFTGILYAGLILTNEGPKVIEFNARFGDPETQVVLPRLKSDLSEVMINILDGKEVNLEWSEKAVLGVVLASTGYPGSYTKEKPIKGLDQVSADSLVFHAGTKQSGDHFVTNGGRVLLVAHESETLESAQKEVYENMKHLKSDDVFYRNDIGFRAISSVSS